MKKTALALTALLAATGMSFAGELSGVDPVSTYPQASEPINKSASFERQRAAAPIVYTVEDSARVLEKSSIGSSDYDSSSAGSTEPGSKSDR